MCSDKFGGTKVNQGPGPGGQATTVGQAQHPEQAYVYKT